MPEELLDVDETSEGPAAEPESGAVAPSAKSPAPAAPDQTKLKRALLKSVECFIPREMSRKVSCKAGHLRRTFGDAGAEALGVKPEFGADKLVCVTVEAIYDATKDA